MLEKRTAIMAQFCFVANATSATALRFSSAVANAQHLGVRRGVGATSGNKEAAMTAASLTP
jgi:hypothetical protein